MKNSLRKILFSMLNVFLGYCLGEFFPGLKMMIQGHPWTAFPIALVIIAFGIIYYLLYEKADQRDMKTVVANVVQTLRVKETCLTDTNVSKIDNPPSLCELLNGNNNVRSCILNKKQRARLADSSCVLQISFVPIDRNGQTVMWKRMPKYHVMRNGDGSVLISFSPYSQMYSQVFTELGRLQVSGDVSIIKKDLNDKLGEKNSVELLETTLEDIYRREVPKKDGISSDFKFVGAFWLPSKKDDKKRKIAPAYSFYVYAVRYDVDFSQPNVVDKIFGREVKGFWGRRKVIYLGKDNDEKMFVVKLGEVDALLGREKIKLGKMDTFVASNYQKFLLTTENVDG